MSKRTIHHESGTFGAEKRRKTEHPTDHSLRAGTIDPQLTKEDYTVGWICAVTTEYVAAQLFLDKKHMRPESQPKEDTNHYTLGEIGGHNVVIAVLPGGEYGTNSAANVANNLLRTFPHIRIGLMVGIGGGAPSKEHDIRLGDVVVSMPSNGNGGVLQYDFGKTIQDRVFCMTGFLNQPPTMLRTAVCGLQVQYEMHGHYLNRAIEIALRKWPKLNRRKYGRPDARNDRLYRADVVHDDEHCCAAATGKGIPDLVSRPPRNRDAHNPAIHYGLIGSANQLMKDALVRDRLSKEKGVLCFEMEAAGLMNHFPCLVIRGICDYSDSHKNKEWQGYAAMTAAAYTKDLLFQIPPSEVVAEKKINELVVASVSRIDRSVEALKSKVNKEEDLKVLNWISRVNYGPQQSDLFNRAQPGTGQWFLNSVQYQDWVNARTRTLFCPGMPGVGKTIIASIVINDLQNRFRQDIDVGVVYIYLNFRRKDEQSVEGLKCILLKQLAERRSSLPENLKSLYNDHEKAQTRPSPEEFSNALHSAFAAYSRVYVVIDALDECEASGACRDRFLREIFDSQSSGKVNFMATSRSNPEIQGMFEDKEGAKLEIRANMKDIRRYLDDHILSLPAFMKDNSNLLEDIKTGITIDSDGMFLLAQLHLDSLKGKMTVGAVRRALNALGSESDAYEHAYSSAMERINGQLKEEAELAKRALSWITFTKRPLDTEELRYALSVEAGMSHLDEENLLQVNVVSVCAGLVTIDEESRIIRLVHYTTQQYFEKFLERQLPNPHLDITKTCITYLSFKTFESGFTHSHEAYQIRLASNPFYAYACEYWGHHARLAPTCQDVLPFLQKRTYAEAASQDLIPLLRNILPSERLSPRKINGLHLAAYFGLKQAQELVGRYDINGRDFLGQTPLLWAISWGTKEIVEILIKNGASIEVGDDHGITPISWAVREGREDIILMLLQNGANVEARDAFGRTPLWEAVSLKKKDIAQTLLENGADIESKCVRGRTVLWIVRNEEDESMKNLLLSWKKVAF